MTQNRNPLAVKNPAFALVLCSILAALLCNGCAVFNRDNTPTLNFVENHLLPAEQPAKALSYPLVFPAGLVAALVDMFIVHPALVTGDATRDVGAACWRPGSFDWQNHYVTECALLVPRTVGSPVVWIGCFLGRAMFDIPPRNAAAGPNRAADDFLSQARQAFKEDRFEDAAALANKVPSKSSFPERQTANALHLAALAKLHRTQDFIARLSGNSSISAEAPFADVVGEEAGRILREGTPVDQVRLLMIVERGSLGPGYNTLAPHVLRALPQLIQRSDRAIGMMSVQVAYRIALRSPTGETAGAARSVLESAAKLDDPVLSVAAQGYLTSLPKQ